MTWFFEPLEVGQRPTFLEAEFANRVLEALNALGNITLEKGERDEVLISEDGVKIVYKFPPTGYEEKVVTICEDGVGVDYTFIVKSST
jgi:hypothetical protein